MELVSPSSYWHTTAEVANHEFPQLKHDVATDVVILGAGITGLTAALHLKRAGRRVVVLEAGRVAAGTSGGTSSHLDTLPDQGPSRLIKDFGEDAARQLTQARVAAINRIEGWCRDLHIDCDFRRLPAYAYTEASERLEGLRAECEAAQRLGLHAEMVERVPLPFPTAGGYCIENQARFHCVRYLQGLARAVDGEGSAIFEHSRATPPEESDPCRVATTHGPTVSARDVVLATHSAFLGISTFDMRMKALQSYVLAARVESDLPDALYWDDAQPYHYTRVASTDDPRLLLIGGADHATGHAGDEREHFEQLEQYVRQRLAVREIESRWSAEFFEPSDGAPYIGQTPLSKHFYIGTGFSGTGLTLGTVAGELIAELILGRNPPLAKVVTPLRLKPLAAGKQLIEEQMHVAKHFVGDRLGGDQLRSLDDVAPGEGRLARWDGRQLALYRDQQGTIHAFAPQCTHAGCHVHWNAAARTWDCPCHGGRYTALGERMYGPPPKDLERVALKDL